MATAPMRVNGTGNIARLKDGRYCIMFTDHSGKRLYRYRRDRKGAEEETSQANC